ncbi:hypothetical protein [Nocardia brasiliensis]|uniref:hypothetical protein n=1 Tax=Nocardia brasiliensis TaxID=37326 RepID=UPI002457ED48|nr:hypothetical protein [Nocardia brasiliensis]
MTDSLDFNRPARTYGVRIDGRAELRVVATVGDHAHAVTSWHTAADPMILSAAEIGRDCGMSASEVVGRELTAVGDAEAMRDFQLVDDPQL